MNKLLGICCLSLLGFSFVASADDFVFNLGMDAQVRSMPLQQGFGSNIVKKSYPQGALYGGIKFNDYFGLELGYQRSITAKRKERLDSDGVSYFGVGLALDPDDYETSRSTVSSQGLYTGLLGFLPISEEYRLKGIASVGVVRMKTKITSALDLFDPFSNTTVINNSQFNFVQTKWIPKLSVGIQHMINDHLGVRALAGWEKTSEFDHIVGVNAKNSVPSKTLYASLKNSTTLGLGLFYDF